MLLCDFHIHTKYSDGAVELRRTVDLFGQAGFDVIAITDHVVNGDSSFGKLAHRFRFTVNEDNFETTPLMSGRRPNGHGKSTGCSSSPASKSAKNYISSDKSAHFLILDIKEFIPACWSYEKIFLEAKSQKALIIACHPHHSSEMATRDTLFLWNNREKYAKYIDAWEIANRDDVFNVISLKKYPYIANSDFHRVRHLYSWKTLLNCEKNTESIKQCIRHNKGVAITLFRN